MPNDKYNPTISILMGVYNIEHLSVFPLCMRSILGQTFTDFELICCDDGSTDHTWDILCEWAKKDKRIHLLRNDKNKGLAKTLNQCLTVAKGSYIARHDADDYSARNRFDIQMQFLSTHKNIDFIGTAIGLYDGSKVYAYRYTQEYPQSKDFLFNDPFVHGSLIFRRKALRYISGYSSKWYAFRVEDYEMLMRMYATGMRGANIMQPLYFFLEDEAAQKRRKYRYRIHEAIVRCIGFYEMGIFFSGWPYIWKPIIVGIIPVTLLRQLKKWHYGE